MEKKVFIVEDDSFIAGLLGQGMEKYGWKVTMDNTGKTAFDQIKTVKPDVAILDIMLPGMDGLEILALLKQDPATKDIPVIMLSNLSEPTQIKKATSLGAAKFLIKATLSIDAIVAEVNKVVKL